MGYGEEATASFHNPVPGMGEYSAIIGRTPQDRTKRILSITSSADCPGRPQRRYTPISSVSIACLFQIDYGINKFFIIDLAACRCLAQSIRCFKTEANRPETCLEHEATQF